MTWLLSPEDQHLLYKAVRDGNVPVVAAMLPKACINQAPFEALWHEPGPEATCLHLAVCCVQPEMVAHLLACGADPCIRAGGHTCKSMLTAFDLFAPARELRPEDVQAVLLMLEDSLAKMNN